MKILILTGPLVLVIAVTLSHAQGGKKPASIPNLCESADELKSCRAQCSKDKDCTDEPNLNCAKKCKEACYILENEFGTRKRQCKQVMLRTIIYDRNPEYIPK